MEILKEFTLGSGYRVTLKKSKAAFPYKISSEQHFSTFSVFPGNDCDCDGWRECLVVFAKDITEAEKEFENMVKSEQRYH